MAAPMDDRESLLYAAVGVFDMLANARTEEDFREAKACRLSVYFAIKKELGLS